MAHQNTTSSKIENNILIGEEDSIDDKCINIGESILSAFKSRPDFIGQVEGVTGEENTFQQMRERSVKCALWLKKIGVGHNDIVTVYTSNRLDTYIPYLATLYIGAILAVWREKRKVNLIHYLQSRPKVIFTDADKALTVFNVAKRENISTKIIVFEKKGENIGEEEEEFECVKSIINNDFDEVEVEKFSCTELESSRDTAVILFSSGTVGAIRNHVTIPHAFFMSPPTQQIPVMSPNDVGLWVESLHWNISLLLTVRAILLNVKAIKINNFYNNLSLFSMEKFLGNFCYIIEKYKVNWIYWKMNKSYYFWEIKVFEKFDVSSLRQVIFGGRIAFHRIFNYFDIQLPNVSLICVYCLPETGIIGYYQRFKQMEEERENKYGRPFAHLIMSKNIRLLIADFNDESRLKACCVGVIWCKSSSLTNGYFDCNSKEISTVTDKNGWFHTDDVGYYGIEGRVEVIDCHRYIMRYREHYFSPVSIEIALLGHPEVKNVGVVPINDIRDGHHPLAIVERTSSLSKVTEEELIQYVAKKVNSFKQIRGVKFVDNLEHDKNGYIKRKSLIPYRNQYVASTKYCCKSLARN